MSTPRCFVFVFTLALATALFGAVRAAACLESGLASVGTMARNGSLLVSPEGLRQVLGMVQSGATGRTRSQLDSLLATCDHGRARYLPAVATSVGLSAIWIDRQYTPSLSFRRSIFDRYHTKLFSLEFSAGNAAGSINRWIATATGGKIKSVPFHKGTTFIAANAFAYSVRWAQPFKKSLTSPSHFYASTGRYDVPMMHGSVLAGFKADKDAQYLSLPFVGGGQMIIGLPLKESPAAALSELLGGATLFQQTEVTLSLPRFALAGHTDFRAYLRGQGVLDMFDGTRAELVPIFGRAGVAITDVFQDATLNVNEEGASMAALSVAAVEAGARREVRFQVDRPFAFVIQNRNGQLMLAGIVAHP